MRTDEGTPGKRSFVIPLVTTTELRLVGSVDRRGVTDIP